VLAIPEEVFNTFFKRDFAQLVVKENNILLFVFDPKDEVIVHENR
jgi:XisH protein